MSRLLCLGPITLFLVLAMVAPAAAKPDSSIKFSVIREENKKVTKETLILPYAFPSESMGTTIGVGGLAKGYHQDQMLFAGTVFGSFEDARGFVAGFWDYRIPSTDRLFFTVYGSYAYYPRQRAYTDIGRIPSEDGAPAGANNSDKDDYIQDDGQDNWAEFKLEYVLPLGAMQQDGMAQYHLKNGLLKSGATGGDEWNPMTSGVSVLMLGQSHRYQDYNTSELGTLFGEVHPLQMSILYNNTDFPTNPSKGSSQWLAYTNDSWSETLTGDWTFVEFEASKYFDLGPSDSSRQRVLALNLWTGVSPSWDTETGEDGESHVVNKPPFFDGARLGGFYRMRGYPNNRFNDKAVLYTAAEYRHTLKWNPLANYSWLRWLKSDWIQLVGFVEGGRVAGEYDSDLLTDWKFDGGIGLRAMLAGSVVRFDIAASEEGMTGWVMFGHPF